MLQHPPLTDPLPVPVPVPLPFHLTLVLSTGPPLLLLANLSTLFSLVSLFWLPAFSFRFVFNFIGTRPGLAKDLKDRKNWAKVNLAFG